MMSDFAERVQPQTSSMSAFFRLFEAYCAVTNDLGQSWVLELEDNHTLEVQLSTCNEANTLPTLTVRMNEI